MLTVGHIRTCMNEIRRTKVREYENDPSVTHNFYMKVTVEGSETTRCFHDSGAIVTCIGSNLLKQLCPRWRSLPKLKPMKLFSHTNHALEILGTHVVHIGIPGTSLHIPHKITVEAGDGDMVLGRDFMSAVQMNLVWEGPRELYAKFRGEGGQWEKTRLAITPFKVERDPISNIDEVTFRPKEEKTMRVEGSGTIKPHRHYVLSRATPSDFNANRQNCVCGGRKNSFVNQVRSATATKVQPTVNSNAAGPAGKATCPAQTGGKHQCRQYLVIETARKPEQTGNKVWRSEVVVKNLCDHPITIHPGNLRCQVDLICKGKEMISLKELNNNPKKLLKFQEFASNHKVEVEPNKEIALNGDAISRKGKKQIKTPRIVKRAPQTNPSPLAGSDTQRHSENSNLARNNEKGKSGGAKQNQVNDKGNGFPDEIEEDERGLDVDHMTHYAVTDVIPWDDIPKEFHGRVRHLLVEKYPEVVSRHFWDIGSTAPTLGKVRLPYAKPAPAYPKIFPLPERKRLILKNLLDQMVKAGLAKGPVPSNQGAPVFLVDRKDTSKPARMVVALTRENDCLADPPVVILPSTDKILAKMGNNVHLITQIDLRQGFYHLKIDDRDLAKSTVATPFGSYEILVCLMGWTIGPCLFNAHITRSLFTEPRTGRPCNALDRYIVVFLDDINIVTPKLGTYDDTVELHFRILDQVLYRLRYHGWKINCEKLVIASKEAKILGWIIKEGRLFADPERIKGIAAAEFPRTRKALMAFVALVGTLRRVMPREASSELAKLYELTSVKKDYAPGKEHWEAFDKCKEYLTTEPLFVKLPDPSLVKVLFSDSSSNIIGGVLCQLKFDEPMVMARKEDVEDLKDFSKFDKLGNGLKRIGVQGMIHEVTGYGQKEGLLRAIICQLHLLKLWRYPALPDEFLAALDMQAEQLHKPELSIEAKLAKREKSELMRLVRLAAIYVGRTIIWFKATLEVETLKAGGGEGALDIPPLYVGSEEIPGKGLLWFSIFVSNAGPWSRFSSKDVFINDWKQYDQKKLFEEVKRRLSLKKGDKPVLEIIAYVSKVLPDSLVRKPIYEKEAMGLLTNLHSTRDMHQGSPAILAILDSATAYFLFSKNISETVHKVHRWSVTLQQRYPNVLLYAVPSEANIADYVSRNYEISEKAKLDVTSLMSTVRHREEMEEKFFTTDELREFTEDIEARENPEGLSPLATAVIAAVSTRSGPKEKGPRRNNTLDVLNESLAPVIMLQNALTKDILQEAQYKELRDEVENASPLADAAAGSQETVDAKGAQTRL